MKRKKAAAAAMLLAAAMIWGGAFAAQRLGSGTVPPFTFTAVSSLIAGLSLTALSALRTRRKRDAGGIAPETGTGGAASASVRAASGAAAIGTGCDPYGKITQGSDCEKAGENPAPLCAGKKTLVWGGLLCGGVLAAACALQQIGIAHTTAGKAGFITTLYIVIVPLLGIFFKRRAGWLVWTGVALAAVGLYFLSVKENFTVGAGDIYVFLCAIAFALHILAISYFSPRTDAVQLCCIQMLTAGVVCLALALIFEQPTFAQLLECWAPLLYVGVLSRAGGYTLQILGQNDLDPTVASLLMSMESVFAAVAGWALLGETLSLREGFGCLLVFGAVILAQIPHRKKLRSTPQEAGCSKADGAGPE